MSDKPQSVFRAFGLVARLALIASLKRRPLKGFSRGEGVLNEKLKIFHLKHPRPDGFFPRTPFEQSEKQCVSCLIRGNFSLFSDLAAFLFLLI